MSEQIVFDGDTVLGHYQVIDMVYEGREARVLFSGKKEAAFSGIALDDKPHLLFDYNQRFRELVLQLQPKRLLLIGGGTYTLPMSLLSELPGVYIDAVEIDDGLETLARQFFGLVDNPRLHIIHMDGREFLETTDNHYDVILIDAFENLKIPTQLSDLSAVELIRNRLRKPGTVAVNVISDIKGSRMSVLRHYTHVYTEVFPSVRAFPASQGYSPWLPQNYLLVSSDPDRSDYGLHYPEVTL